MRKIVRNTMIGMCGIVASFCFLRNTAHAASLLATPSLSFEEAWDSNVYNTSSDEESDYIFRVVPRLKLSLETSYSTVSLTGGYEIEKYWEHDDLDSNSATKDIDLSASNPIPVSPRMTIRPAAMFVETDDLTRKNRLTVPPSPVLPPSDTTVTERTKVRYYRAALVMTYQVSPRTDASIGGGFAKQDYVTAPSGSDLEDSKTVTGDATISYRFTPRFSSGVFFNTTYDSYNESPNTRSYSAGLTGRYDVSQLYVWSWRAGATYLKESASATDPEHDEWSPTGATTLTYSKQYFRATLDASYGVTPGSFGQTTETWTVYLSMTDRITERWSWDLSGYYQYSRSAFPPETEEISTWSGSVGLRYQPVLWASIGLGGNVFRQDAKKNLGQDLNRDSVVLDVTFSKPYKVY